MEKPDKPFEEYSEFEMLKIYARCGNFNDSAKCCKVSRNAWSKKWYDSGLPSPRVTRTNTSDEVLPYYEVGIVSDTHWGSVYQQKTIFDSFIADCRDRGIQTLVHCGDVIDGIMPQRYHDEVRFLDETPEFEQYVIDNYPGGFARNYITTGNHETSLNKFNDAGYNFCRSVVAKRTDLTYIPRGTSLIGPGNVFFSIHHGGSSCASPGENRNKRLRTRVLQLMSECCFGHIWCFGHCHSTAYIPSYMNNIIIGVGCFQAPNDYLLRSYGGADVCGLILGYNVLDGRPVNIKLDFRYAKEYGGIVENDY